MPMAKSADTNNVTRTHAGRSTTGSAGPTDTPSLIFHKRIEAFDPKRHGDLTLAPSVSYAFGAGNQLAATQMQRNSARRLATIPFCFATTSRQVRLPWSACTPTRICLSKMAMVGQKGVMCLHSYAGIPF